MDVGLVTGFAAGVSGSIAATATTPADVIKTQIMLGAKGAHGGTGGPSGIMNVTRAVIREEGVTGLFRGGALRAAWSALGGGLYLGSYEVTKLWLGHRPTDRTSTM